VKSADEIRKEYQAKWGNLVNIYSESMDAFFDRDFTDEDLSAAIAQMAMENKPLEMRFTRNLVTEWLEEYCFKDGFFGKKQIRFLETDLKPIIKFEPIDGRKFYMNWPFPDSEKDQFIRHIFEKSKAYQAFKEKLISAGYELTEVINELRVELKIVVKNDG
jgi:hypothetical protein